MPSDLPRTAVPTGAPQAGAALFEAMGALFDLDFAAVDRPNAPFAA
jgi:hypothetical protein